MSANTLPLPPVEAVDALPPEALPVAVLGLAALQARVAARWMEVEGHHRTSDAQNDTLVDAESAAKLLGMSKEWVYDHADRLPFTRRVGRRTLRFSLANTDSSRPRIKSVSEPSRS